METNVNYTLVGLFVMILLSFLILAIIWLSSGFSLHEDFTIYQVNMTEAVSGLNLNAPVDYNGVPVGSVKSIEINHKNTRIIKLLLKIKNNTPVTQATRAKLEIRSLSGISNIALEDQGTDLSPLRAKKGEPYPVIQTIPSLYLRLGTALTKLNNNFNQFSESIESLLNDENLRAIKLILQSGQSTIHLFETQTMPAINQAIINLNDITRDLSGVSAEIKQNPAVLIRGMAPPALGPGEH